MGPNGPVNTAITAGTSLQVFDAQGNCTMVPFANYQAAAQAVNNGTSIAGVAAMYGGSTCTGPAANTASYSGPAGGLTYGGGPMAGQPLPQALAPVTVVFGGAGQPLPQALAPATAVTTPVNYSSAEVPGSFSYTADIETVENTAAQYGDTWDSPQRIVNNFYAAGVVPGSVTPAMAFSALTGLAGITTASTASLTSPSSWPWYYWAAAAGIGLFLLSK